MFRETEIACDGERCDAMISGHHHHLDAGGLAVGDRFTRPFSQWIDQTDETEELQLPRRRRILVG